MIVFEYIVVGLTLALAVIYLIKAFWPKSNSGGCGCGTENCKVAKPKLN